MQVPEWSGEFWTSADGDLGYLSVWIGDEEQHRPPGGWRLIRQQYDPDTQADTFVYRRVSPWCMAG